MCNLYLGIEDTTVDENCIYTWSQKKEQIRSNWRKKNGRYLIFFFFDLLSGVFIFSSHQIFIFIFPFFFFNLRKTSAYTAYFELIYLQAPVYFFPLLYTLFYFILFYFSLTCPLLFSLTLGVVNSLTDEKIQPDNSYTVTNPLFFIVHTTQDAPSLPASPPYSQFPIILFFPPH